MTSATVTPTKVSVGTEDLGVSLIGGSVLVGVTDGEAVGARLTVTYLL